MLAFVVRSQIRQWNITNIRLFDDNVVDFEEIRRRFHVRKGSEDSIGPLFCRIYAIAIRFRLKDVAQKAARATLRLSLASHNCADLKHISAFAIQNLYNYHFKCKEAVRDLLASESWAKDMKTVARHLTSRQEDTGKPHTHGDEYFSLKRLEVVGGGALWLSTGKTTSWWSDYVEVMMYVLNDRPSVPIPSLVEGLEETMSLDKCSQCSKYGYERLLTVSHYLASIIDKTISKVPFEVEY